MKILVAALTLVSARAHAEMTTKLICRSSSPTDRFVSVRLQQDGRSGAYLLKIQDHIGHRVTETWENAVERNPRSMPMGTPSNYISEKSKLSIDLTADLPNVTPPTYQGTFERLTQEGRKSVAVFCTFPR